MSVERFTLDAHVLIYTIDNLTPRRRDLAADIVVRAARRDCVLMTQALGEFFWAVTRKGIMPRSEAAAQVRDWSRIFLVAGAASSALLTALDAAERGVLSFWDAHLLAGAGGTGCTAIISEDMSDGMTFGGVTVRHPFAGGRLAPAVEALLT
jgi:predicted nucleic acid-binding protein